MKKQTMGEMISTLRKENNMTQLQLAEKMGVTDKAVSKWERDLSCPDIDSIPRLAEIFGISTDELMQVKQRSKDENDGENIIQLILKVIPLAMGVAVTALSVMKQIDLYSGFSMLGIGVACLALKQMK